ncbi:helix-turn-helix domain-containing protein [Streptomyces roseifaciens]|uniref:helix-turn-helix domain-containing protein n=1 Tax=Streptomyces roseifaciens TaxID=1488406 RepID=UPI0007C7DAC9|nr:helix-turn-helix transcriptional regulator [Streptomyces roseifaciens]
MDTLDFPAEVSTGERIRILRESRGMSREVLAGLCARKADWLKKIEKGERELNSHSLLLRLAAALQIPDLSILTGGTPEVVQPVPLGRFDHPTMPAIWGAVMSRSLAPLSTAVDVQGLQGRVEQTWRLWHTSGRNRTEVGALLPALIRDAETAARTLEGAQRRTALVALSDVYRLTGQATAYVAPAELAWVVADRALAAAQRADDPAAIAAAAWNMGNILREARYSDGPMWISTPFPWPWTFGRPGKHCRWRMTSTPM